MTPRIKTLLLALFLAGALGTGAKGQELDPTRIQVRVLPAAEVFGEVFTLGEIAEMDGADLKAVKELSAVELGRSPLPGRELRISEAQIRSRLTRMIEDDRLSLSVPRNATVTRASVRVPGKEIEALVLERAQQDAGGTAEEFKQQLSGTIGDAVLPKGEVAWEVRPLGRHLSGTGGRSYLVVARVDGNEAWHTTVRLNQKVYREFVVAKTAIRRNQVIAAEDVSLVRRPFTGTSEQNYVSTLSEVVGKQARRPIAPDEPLYGDLFAAPYAVEEGGRVRVVYETPQLVVEVQGVALTNARIGDFIPVRNLQSGKIIYGILEANETIRVN